MSISVKQKVEDDFILLKGSASQKQWQNPVYFYRLAVDMEKSDLPLAYRLIQRAHNLNPQGPKIKKKLEDYSKELKASHSSYFEETSSKENSKTHQKLKDKIIESTIFNKLNTLRPFTIFVLIPCLIFFLYQSLWSSVRYESQAQILVKQPDNASSLSPEMALLSGFGVANVDNDAKLVEAFIYSTDMLIFLQDKLALREHYSDFSIDFFNRLHQWDAQEDFVSYFEDHVVVIINAESSIITVQSQAFTPEFAQKLNQLIIERAEWFINEIGHQMANEQLAFISKEHERWTDNLEKVQKQMLAYQQKHKLLDPTSEGVALQSIAYSLEGQLASKSAELKAAERVMSEQAPEVLRLKNEWAALTAQLASERQRLTLENEENISVSQVISKFSDLRIDFELAMQAYAGSLASLEKTRVEAYRQLKFLVTVEASTLPEQSTYPKVFYNSLLFMLVTSLIFGISSIVVATVKELS